jgi:hypothetical protein
MLLIFTKTVNNSRTWLRLVPSIRVITMHTALKIQNLHMKHTKIPNKTLYYSIRRTYTSTQVRPCSSPVPRNTCKQQQYIIIFKQYTCIYHKNRICILYTVQYIATTKVLFRILHLNLNFTKKICYLHYFHYSFLFLKIDVLFTKTTTTLQNCKYHPFKIKI